MPFAVATSKPVVCRREKSKYSAQPFYLTLLAISVLTLLSFCTEYFALHRHGNNHESLRSQAAGAGDISRLLKRDTECRLVHEAEDKCAFIKANCPDEEAGLLSYLTLYYCVLPQASPVAFVLIALWLALLFTTIGIAASDFFCINLSTIATILGMSESMAGVTFLAFGNGSPDVFSTFAAMSTHSGSLAIGELIGAAGFITAVVAGSMALVREFKVGKKSFVRDIGFFIVAASFSMSFLADGHLHLWECCVMIAFYLFYVATVVTWHWYLQRRRRHRERDSMARGHYAHPGSQEIEVLEEDGDDEDVPAGRTSLGNRSQEDFSALEGGSNGELNENDSDNDSERSRLLATEMSNSMRVVRPRHGRSNTLNPIRPSLVGALEFRSVLASLQKSSQTNTALTHIRRYSDNPTASSENLMTSAPDLVVDGNGDAVGGSSMQRPRGATVDDPSRSKSLDPATLAAVEGSDSNIVAVSPKFAQYLDVPKSASGPPSVSGQSSKSDAGSTSPASTLSIPSNERRSRDISPMAPLDRQRPELTLLPPSGFPGAHYLRKDVFHHHTTHQTDSPHDSPKTKTFPRPELMIPDTSKATSSVPNSPFPTYTDSPLPMSAQSQMPPSLVLPDAIISPQSTHDQHFIEQELSKPIRWWPYRILPPPGVILSAIFPTLTHWREKSIWDKILSVLTTPSIFLLAITLPVVETESDEEGDDALPPLDQARSRSRTLSRLPLDSPSLEPVVEPEWLQYRRSMDDQRRSPRSPRSPVASTYHGFGGHGTAATVAVSTENLHHHSYPPQQTVKHDTNDRFSGHELSTQTPTPPEDWNRWLVIIQLFTGPIFVMIIVWANGSDNPNPKDLLLYILYSLLGSMIALAILLLTTSRNKVPKLRFLLCFVGFVVSIAWISTIANEVVGVLKAFGVILGISDAILGLTVFAVGNSLGDLVADITVARLGYPFMALSACFGGPMLNILLGIGISGVYMTIKEADHKHSKHPGKPVKYKPYSVDVSGSLMISAITLIVTLVGLLIVVPLSKWHMTRKIGWGLIILWTVGTIVNLVIEVTGVWSDAILL